MADNSQADGSARAVQCLNHNDTSGSHKPTINVNVPVDINYNMQRFLNPQGHAEDRHLRPPQSPTPLTEAESRARMAGILASMMPNPAPNQKR
ncbi:hypothetical protein F4779DRAFT_238863 [Xylariaceae sp. FL0662B]|nr:hypothetical protein F4779DRAFT_238863 [Xylariaceae sp. FL0662B]